MTKYRAFGMQMAGGHTPSVNPIKRLYNGGSEWQDDIDGLADYYSTFFREYDAVIGRFNGVDPESEMDISVSVYTYAGNDPINYYDPLGNIKGYSLLELDVISAIRSNHNKEEVQRMGAEMQNNYLLWLSTNYSSPWSWDGGVGINGGGSKNQWNDNAQMLSLSSSFTKGIIKKTEFEIYLPFYETQEAAAKAWGELYNSSSKSEDKEYGGVIFGYLINGKNYYSFNIPNVGSNSSVDYQTAIPRGAKLIAWIHSHAAYTKESDDHFSTYPSLLNVPHYDSEQYGKYRNDRGGGEYFMFLTTPSGYLQMWPANRSTPIEQTIYNFYGTKPLIVSPEFNPGKSENELRNTKPVYLVPINLKGVLGAPIRL